MRVNTGDVVWSQYLDVNNEIQKAMFVVLYHECDVIRTSTNFSGIKLSTKERGFPVPIKKGFYPFTIEDTYINCDRIFPLREDKVTSIEGRLNQYHMNKVIQQVENMVNRAKMQCENCGYNLFEENKPVHKKLENRIESY